MNDIRTRIKDMKKVYTLSLAKMKSIMGCASIKAIVSDSKEHFFLYHKQEYIDVFSESFNFKRRFALSTKKRYVSVAILNDNIYCGAEEDKHILCLAKSDGTTKFIIPVINDCVEKPRLFMVHNAVYCVMSKTHKVYRVSSKERKLEKVGVACHNKGKNKEDVTCVRVHGENIYIGYRDGAIAILDLASCIASEVLGPSDYGAALMDFLIREDVIYLITANRRKLIKRVNEKSASLLMENDMIARYLFYLKDKPCLIAALPQRESEGLVILSIKEV